MIPLNIFEGILDFEYNYHVEERTGLLYESPMQLFPALLVGPYIIEMDDSGLCIPKFYHSTMFDPVPQMVAKQCSLQTLVQFMVQWNQEEWKARSQGVKRVVKRSFMEELVTPIGLEIDPIYSLLLREYSPDMHGLKRHPFFASRPMVFPLRHSLVDKEDLSLVLSQSDYTLNSTNSIEMSLKNKEKVTCIKFGSEAQFGLFMFHLRDKAPLLRDQRAECILVVTLGFCFYLRTRKEKSHRQVST